jgi:hypothetical protein
VGEPTLPTVYIDTPATGSNNQAGTAYLASSVSVGTNVKVTTLYMLGTTDTLAAKAEMDPADPTLLKVTLTAAGKAGVYQGLVHTDGAVKPLAVVFARLT